LVAAAIALCPAPAAGQWIQDGNPISTAPGDQILTTAAWDGGGGVYIGWQDPNSGPFVQHLLFSGAIAQGWPIGGVGVGAGYGYVGPIPVLVADGVGGCFACWSAGANIYVQRVTGAGGIAATWPTGGLVIHHSSDGNPNVYQMTAAVDGSGGLYVVWADHLRYSIPFENGYDSNTLWVQHVTAAGSIAPGWSANGGIVDNTQAINYLAGYAVPDGAGGVIIAERGTTDVYAALRVLAIRYNASGGRSWVSEALGYPGRTNAKLAIAPDGAGGAFIAWQEAGDAAHFPINVQRITSAGSIAPSWPAGGVLASVNSSFEADPEIIADGAGGAFVGWENWTGYNIYVSRLTSDGLLPPGWPPGGLAVGTASGTNVQVIRDGAGGAVLAWCDYRPDFSNRDVYAARISGFGVLLWAQKVHVGC